MKSKEEENEKFTNELEALNKVYAQVVEQRDAYYLELETLKRSSTPRLQHEMHVFLGCLVYFSIP